jgi:assimilatory nitrate reductase catalytic subunit
MAEARYTTCPYCGVGCGLVVSPTVDGWAVGGDPAHPANRGRLCSKGAALMDTVTAEDSHPAGPVRLLHPSVDGRQTAWPDAIGVVAERLSDTIAAHGPDSIAFYVSGQLLTEDYYVANKLLKGFIGSPHIDTNSRLCMASTVAGHKRAFGADAVPGCYEDLDLTDLVVLVGSNMAWCHPVLAQHLRQARRDHGTRVVVIDPRRTATCDDADLHLALTPGSDVTLFNGLLVHLAAVGAVDLPYVRGHTGGFDATLAAARAEAPDIAAVAAACGLAEADVARFYTWFARTARTVTAFSQGVNQSSSGTDKVNAILNVHLATGRVGRPGASPFSLTGQPNAMGGREVGGLANQLAAHMDPDSATDVDRLRRFWKAPRLRGGQGLKAVDLFRAVDDGRIKALWIMGTNPAVSLPEGDRVRRALANCPTVIVSDVVAETDTLAFAHIRLPAAAWGEKDGTVTNSERRISRQRPFRAPPGQARPDWRIISDVAAALGFGRAFAYRRPADIFREHARLSAFENDGQRVFDIGGLARLGAAAYESLRPIQWPVRKAEEAGAARLFADGHFATVDGRAHLIPVAARPPAARPDSHWPLIANTGRYRDHWHTLTRTALAPRLSAHRPEPLLEIAAADAALWAVTDGGLARVDSREGSVLLRVAITDDQPPGQVFLPMHWSETTSGGGAVGRLVAGHVDPLSGQPESKAVPVRVTPWRPSWQGVLLTRRRPALAAVPYRVAHTAGTCMVHELAGDAPLGRLFADDGLEVVEYRDDARGVMRRAWLAGGRLEACLFVGRERPAVARDWLSGRFGETLNAAARADLLAGRSGGDAAACDDSLVCSCAQVTRRAIVAALRDGRATTAEDIGRLLRAGTGCGSCLTEVKALAAAQAAETPAASDAA